MVYYYNNCQIAVWIQSQGMKLWKLSALAAKPTTFIIALQ